MALLDLVALATVADVAPLVGREPGAGAAGAFGDGAARATGAGGAGRSGAARPAAPRRTPGFVFGPRINAGGRIGAGGSGRAPAGDDGPHEAAALAERLDQLNTERREIEARVREAALAQAEARGLDGPLVWAADDGWHPGVVGIVAARLKEATNRPAIVIGMDGEVGKGSGRSVAGVDLGAAIHRLAAEGLLIARAAGTGWRPA